MKKPFVLCLLAVFTAAAASAQMRFTLKTDLLDLTNSVAQPGRVRVPLTTNDSNMEIINWMSASTTNNAPGEFLIQLLAPTSIGSLIAYEAGTVTYQANGKWKPLPAGADAGRKLQIIPFPSGEMIESVKITVPAHLTTNSAPGKALYQAVLPLVALIPVRVVNVAQTANVKVSNAEKTSPELRKTQPWLNQPETLVDGFTESRTSPWILLISNRLVSLTSRTYKTVSALGSSTTL